MKMLLFQSKTFAFEAKFITYLPGVDAANLKMAWCSRVYRSQIKKTGCARNKLLLHASGSDELLKFGGEGFWKALSPQRQPFRTTNLTLAINLAVQNISSECSWRLSKLFANTYDEHLIIWSSDWKVERQQSSKFHPRDVWGLHSRTTACWTLTDLRVERKKLTSNNI